MACGLGSSLAEPSSTAIAPEKKKDEERKNAVTSRKAKVVMILLHSFTPSLSLL